MTIKAHFDGHVLVPDEPLDLPVGQKVELELRQRLPAGRKRDALQRAFQTFDTRFPTFDVKVILERTGKVLDENDVWIAATTLVLAGTLISADKDFQSVPGLRVEDWSV